MKLQLLTGVRQGFIIPSNITKNPLPPTYGNHKSALDNFRLVSIKLQQELNKHRIAGPFSIKPPGLIISPLAAVPKKGVDEIRVIHDLSFPLGNSVNSHIPREVCGVQYELIDDCLQIVFNLGKGCLMSKADISSAFRILPVSPASYRLLGFQWCDRYFFDRCLPMGCSVSCNKFELLSTAIQWILTHKLKVHHMSHILDDFMFLGPSDSRQCALSLQAFFSLSESIGLPIKQEKTVLPSTCVQLHGLEVCSVAMEVRLPQDKVQKALQLLHICANKRTIKLKQLQSLIGTLSFATKAVVAGRTFLRRLINLTIGVNNSSHHINVNSQARLDIKAWQEFLLKFNGRRLISSQVWSTSVDFKFFSDASGMGYAAICGHKWIQGSFPESWRQVNIAVKELLPITLAFRLWHSMFSNKNIVFHVDNMAVVMVLQSQTSREPNIMKLLRPMVVQSMLSNIQFYAQHIIGKHNLIPDLLSRFQMEKALKLAPWLDPEPHLVPLEWMPWSTKPN